MQRFRGGLVFKAHRLCVSLNSRLESNKEEREEWSDGVEERADIVQHFEPSLDALSLRSDVISSIKILSFSMGYPGHVHRSHQVQLQTADRFIPDESTDHG